MSHTHRSPWLTQLAHDRPGFRLEHDVDTDVAIVGAGIAGVTTAYMILKHTPLKVALVDAGRIAHGATGHNAGQVVSYFERPLTELVEEFGMEKTIHAQKDIEDAWFLLEDMMKSCSLQTPLFRCMGHAGFTAVSMVLNHLEQMHIRSKAGLQIEPMLVVADPAIIKHIPQKYETLYLPMPRSTILNILGTDDTEFIAALNEPKGCMNSALFCEELAGYLVANFADRIVIAEHLPVETITLEKDNVFIKTNGPNIHAKKVILCTNGFETVKIENHAGTPIDQSQYSLIQGMIGYMTGYFDAPETSTTAISYFRQQKSHLDPYVYLTRRPFMIASGKQGSLICLGGPDRILPDRADYDPDVPFPADIDEELERSLRMTYRNRGEPPQRAFAWHGLMGYTRTGVRCIGTEPRNPALLYNLGCNGVGILPSIHGAKRIAQILAGKKLPASIFDPVLAETTN